MKLSCPEMKLVVITVSIVLMVCLIANSTTAQTIGEIEVPLSMDPVGSGARALGMGGAFIGIADDATAASWNPGGLIQLETPEVSVVGAYFQRTESNTFEAVPEANGEKEVDSYNLNYLSAVYPFKLFDRNMVVSASQQYLFDFSRDIEFPTARLHSQFTSYGDVDIHHQGGLTALGIAYALQVMPTVSFGLTLNFWQDGLYGDDFKLETTYRGSGTSNGDYFTINESWSDTYKYRGFNSNLGLLWDINNQMTIGFVLKTPFTVDLDHHSKYDLETVFPGNPSLSDKGSVENDTDEELDIPMSYGIGFAYRFSDSLTTSLDLYRIEWGDFVLRDEDGNEISPITGNPADESDINPMHQVRLGTEYLFITDTYVIPLRGGIFYDPSPSDGGSDGYYGYSFGSGYARGKIVFDMAYQYRFGRDVAEFILEDYDFSQDMREHTIYASIIYHF